MTARASEAASLGAVALLAMVVTVVLAAPVLRAPGERIFGLELVGRHFDPFTVMEQFTPPVRWHMFLQPITDLPGVWLAKVVGAVAAYNLVVLISFPLTAVAAYLLARHCALTRASAALAAFAAAFSPFHLAHAAYHPHVAQLQWLPLYLLVLWRCLDRPTSGALALLAGAIAAVTLSNFYGGLIAAAITPVAVAAYWFFTMRRAAAPLHRLLVTSAALAIVAIAGAGYAFYAAAGALHGDGAVAFARGDLSKYSATWWSYLALPAAHPWFGQRSGGTTSSGAHVALLERQVGLGWGLLALSAVALAAAIRHRATGAVLSAVPVLTAIAIVALLCSIAPPAWLHDILPMFRSYARFGSVVQLMVAILAAIGVERLWQSRNRLARLAAIALVTVAVAEYAVWPPVLWRDVLPTAAHRWVARQPPATRALDCYAHTQESQSVQWLTGGRVILRPPSVADCREPGVIATLSATGFTHVLVRRNTPEGRWFERGPVPPGLRVAMQFDDAQVFAVTAPPSLIRTVQTHAFYPVEFDEGWTWRWMGPQAAWTVVNRSERSLLASVDLETNAFDEPRHLTVLLDGTEVQQVVIDPQRAIRRIGPMAIGPGDHTLVFRASAPPTVADHRLHNGDPRALSVAFGDWRWSVDGGRQ